MGEGGGEEVLADNTHDIDLGMLLKDDFTSMSLVKLTLPSDDCHEFLIDVHLVMLTVSTKMK